MKRLQVPLLALAFAFGSLGVSSCVGAGQVEVAAPSHQLIAIGPDIWVVSNWDYPVYYYDGFYWRLTDGIWYRSTWYTGGFVRVGVVPRIVIRHHHPRRYIHYRARRGVRVRKIPQRRHRTHTRPAPRRHDRRR